MARDNVAGTWRDDPMTDPIAPDALREAPDTDEVRDVWVDWHLNHLPREQGIRLVPAAQAQFDAWLSAVVAKERDAEVERLVQRVLPCDGGCNYNSGPEEDCSRHGRPVREVWEIVSSIAAQREVAQDRIARALAATEDWSLTDNGIRDALRNILTGTDQ